MAKGYDRDKESAILRHHREQLQKREDELVENTKRWLARKVEERRKSFKVIKGKKKK